MKNKFFFHFLFTILFASAISSQTLFAQTLASDAAAYHASSQVTLNGSGFNANEIVEVQVLHSDSLINSSSAHQPWQVTADADGNFQTTWQVPSFPEEDRGALEAYATGLSSALAAQASFTNYMPLSLLT